MSTTAFSPEIVTALHALLETCEKSPLRHIKLNYSLPRWHAMLQFVGGRDDERSNAVKPYFVELMILDLRERVSQDVLMTLLMLLVPLPESHTGAMTLAFADQILTQLGELKES